MPIAFRREVRLLADGTVKIGTELDKDGLKRGLSGLGDFAKKGFSAIGGMAADITKTVTAATGAATAGIAGLAKISISAYADYEQLVGGVETLYGSAYRSAEEYAEGIGVSMDFAASTFEDYQNRAKDVLDNANNAYKTAGLSTNAYMETVTSFSASLISSLGEYAWQAANYADMAITDMSDNANKMGSSMESIQNAYQGFAKQNFTMLDNLKLGYGGTQQEMDRLLRDAEELAGFEPMSLDRNNFADVVEAIHIIQENMGITGTTSKEAASTISGSIGMTKAAWENLMTGMADPEQDLGALLNNLVDSGLAVVGNLAPRIMETVPRVIEGISSLLREVAGHIPESMSTNILPALVEGMTGLLESAFVLIGSVSDIGGELLTSIVSGFSEVVIDMTVVGLRIITGLAESIAQNAPVILSTLGNVIYEIANAIYTYVPDLIASGQQILTALMDGITQNASSVVVSASQLINDFVTGLAAKLPDIILSAADIIISLAEALTNPNALSNMLNAALSLIEGLAAGLLEALPRLAMAVPGIIANIVTTLVANIPRLMVAAVNILSSLGRFLIESIGVLLAAIPKLFKDIVKGFIKMDWGQVGKNIIDGILNGVISAAGRLVDSVVEAARKAVQGVKDFLKIRSPSRLMRDMIGKNMIAGINEGVDEEAPEMEKHAVSNVKRTVEEMQKENASGYVSKMRSQIEKPIYGNDMDNPWKYPKQTDPKTGGNAPQKIILEKGTIEGEVVLDGEKVGTLVAPAVDTELGNAAELEERGI